MPTPEQSQAISIRVKHTHRSKYNNQRRHDLRIGHQPSYVASDRTEQNRVLVALPAPAIITADAKQLRQLTNPTREMRADAAVATIGIITFGLAAQAIFSVLSPDQQDAAYMEIAQRTADEHGTTVRGLVVHVDETAPHAHVVWDCRSYEGVPMSRLMKGSRLQDIAAEVIKEFAPEIVRGVRKSVRIDRGDKSSQIYNRSVQQLHNDLPLELAAKRKELAYQNGRVDEMRARVAQLQEKEQLNAKEAKRLAIYLNRLVAREQEFQNAKSALETDLQNAKRENEALSIKARVLDKAEQELDEQELVITERNLELTGREQEVVRRESILDRLSNEIGKLIGEVANRLGVGKSLTAIRERITSAKNDLNHHGPSIDL